MATQTSAHQFQSRSNTHLSRAAWVKIGLFTSAASIIAVLITQAVALSIWPETAAFKPLDSYPRTALFTFIPVVVATILLAWLNKTSSQPRQTFLKISAAVLILSFIPDYVLPVPNRTLLASSIAAFMHVVAGVVTIGMLLKLKDIYDK